MNTDLNMNKLQSVMPLLSCPLTTLGEKLSKIHYFVFGRLVTKSTSLMKTKDEHDLFQFKQKEPANFDTEI